MHKWPALYMSLFCDMCSLHSEHLFMLKGRGNSENHLVHTLNKSILQHLPIVVVRNYRSSTFYLKKKY